jgi:hypothetical protein
VWVRVTVIHAQPDFQPSTLVHCVMADVFSSDGALPPISASGAATGPRSKPGSSSGPTTSTRGGDAREGGQWGSLVGRDGEVHVASLLHHRCCCWHSRSLCMCISPMHACGCRSQAVDACVAVLGRASMLCESESVCECECVCVCVRVSVSVLERAELRLL